MTASNPVLNRRLYRIGRTAMSVRLIFSETEVFFGPHRDMLWE
jgi:hypothetical protein